MTLPKISIITISLNSADTIEETIASVTSQDYARKEYIVIDGGSDDGTLDIIEAHKEAIDLYVSEKDQGISDAFNKGLAKATGDLIAFINAGDYLLPGALSEVARRYDGESDIYCGNLLLLDPKTHYTCLLRPSVDFPVMPFFRRPAHQGLFVRKELYQRLGGYDTRLRYAMDLDFLMRASRAKAVFKRVDIPVAVFRLGGITSSSVFRKRREYLYLIRKNGGSKLQAYTFYAFLVITQTTKGLLRMTGIDIVRRLRYRKHPQPNTPHIHP